MRRFGPGFLVAAAFIGPGTVTTASLAGAGHGLGLAWAVVCAVAAACVLQEMAARLGVVSGRSLGEAVRDATPSTLRLVPAALITVGIGVGNAAYQTGNVTGAALGLAEFGLLGAPGWTLIIGVAAAGVLWSGTQARIATLLMLLVGLMTLTFAVTAVLVAPDPRDLALALVRPHIPDGALLTVVALVGTTVVPYNLFLHSAAARAHWHAAGDRRAALGEARRDTLIAVVLGGLVTLAILVTAAPFAALGGGITGAADMARQLEPTLGVHARQAFALGLFAAGFTSAITAPLAAAWAVGGVLGWDADLRSARARVVWGWCSARVSAWPCSGTGRWRSSCSPRP